MSPEKKADRLKYMAENIYRHSENIADTCNKMNISDNIRTYSDHRFTYSVR